MNRALKVVEFTWVIMAVICLIEFIRLWNSGDTDSETFYIFGGGVVVAGFMFWLRRNQRLKYLKRQQQKQDEEQV